MAQQNKDEVLADEIREILTQGIDLSNDVVHFIDSTFANPTVAELQAVLADDSNCEKDSLVELLFFPDESIQIRLEESIERLRPRAEDVDNILDCLCREALEASFRFGDGRGTLKLSVPADAVRQFLVRLKISKHLDSGLIECIRNYGDEENFNRFKVKIRNSRFAPSTNKTGFLCRFFDKIGSRSSDVWECLEFLLGFLDEIEADADIYPALMARKKSYFISLQKAKKLDDRIEKYNVETLMARGERIVMIDQADVRKKMRIIDRISRAVFDKTEYFEQPVRDDGQIQVDSPEKIKSIIEKLS